MQYMEMQGTFRSQFMMRRFVLGIYRRCFEGYLQSALPVLHCIDSYFYILTFC